MLKKLSCIILLFLIVSVSCNLENRTKKDQIRQAESGIVVGKPAPDLIYPDPDGELISLSSLRGKMVLIDFWASWCPPCRVENPKLVSIYRKYKNKEFKHGKGFTIYSVSCDRNHEDWVEAINSDGLIWKNHVSDLKGWDAEATYTYKISYIPFNLLIDGEGIIIAKELHGNALTNTLDSLILN
jgi:thiol-disulfide isomerase/thioredoxin